MPIPLTFSECQHRNKRTVKPSQKNMVLNPRSLHPGSENLGNYLTPLRIFSSQISFLICKMGGGGLSHEFFVIIIQDNACKGLKLSLYISCSYYILLRNSQYLEQCLTYIKFPIYFH